MIKTDQAINVKPPVQSMAEKREHCLQAINNLYVGCGDSPMTRAQHAVVDKSMALLVDVINQVLPAQKAAPPADPAVLADEAPVEEDPVEDVSEEEPEAVAELE